jgi:CCR4-NOT transcription complex subunit 6
MLENYSIEFNDCARDAAAALGLDDGECRRYMNRLSRDNIAQVFVLEVLTRTAAGANVRQPRQMTNVCIVNTHLYSNHARPDVKLWQTMTLMREVEQMALTRDIAVMVCGDFNSEPDSAVHEFMGTGALELPHPELLQSDTLGILPEQQDIVHGVEFASIMEAALGSEPPYTNFTGNFKGTLDYIWYTPGRLRVLAVTNVPDPNELFEQCGEGLPSANYPSDHVMLCADVAFAVSGTGTVTRPQTHRRHLLTGAGAAAAVIASKAKYSSGSRSNSGRG